MANKSQTKYCAKGHRFQKASDCSVCPICEAAVVPATAWLGLFGGPARRALEAAGIDSLTKLAAWSDEALLKLHGFGPSSLPLVKELRQKAGA
jgi:predicted RecB family nuclease